MISLGGRKAASQINIHHQGTKTYSCRRRRRRRRNPLFFCVLAPSLSQDYKSLEVVTRRKGVHFIDHMATIKKEALLAITQ